MDPDPAILMRPTGLSRASCVSVRIFSQLEFLAPRVENKYTTCIDISIYSFIYNIYKNRNNVADWLKHKHAHSRYVACTSIHVTIDYTGILFVLQTRELVLPSSQAGVPDSPAAPMSYVMSATYRCRYVMTGSCCAECSPYWSRSHPSTKKNTVELKFNIWESATRPEEKSKARDDKTKAKVTIEVTSFRLEAVVSPWRDSMTPFLYGGAGYLIKS